MDTKINKNLKAALTQVRGRYYDRGDIYLEIPVFFIQTEDYNDFGLSILNPRESSLKYIRIVNPTEIKENNVRLRLGERTEQFDLADDNFREQILDFIYTDRNRI